MRLSETYDVNDMRPWMLHNVDVEVTTMDKETAAKHHAESNNRITMNRENLFYYTDGSKLEGKVGAGIAIFRSKVLLEEKRST